MTVLFEPDNATGDALAFAIGGDATVAGSLPALTRALTDRPDDLLVVVGPGADVDTALELAEQERVHRPALGVVLVRHRVEPDVLVRALRSGVREVVAAEDRPGLASACARSYELSQQMLRSTHGGTATGPTRRGQVVTVFSGKGGAGKTTIASNLAAQLARGGRRQVCLVDLDLQFGDLAVALQLKPVQTIAEAQHMSGDLDEAALRNLVVGHSPGLDTLLAPVEPSQADQIKTGLVDDILRTLTAMYEYVVVDTPPSFTDQVLVALDRTDLLVLVTTPDLPAVKNLRLTIDMVRRLGLPAESFRILLNRAGSDVGVTANDVERLAATKIAAHVPSSRAVSVAINRGEVLSIGSPKHPVSKAIERFVDEQFGPATGVGGAEPVRRTGRLRRGRAAAA